VTRGGLRDPRAGLRDRQLRRGVREGQAIEAPAREDGDLPLIDRSNLNPGFRAVSLLTTLIPVFSAA
jgi:hypothetical protein